LLALYRPVPMVLLRLGGNSNCASTTMTPKDEDFIRFYRDAVIAGHDDPAAETMRHFNLSRDYIVRLLNETIAGCKGQDIRNWKSGER
jgi:hypothetical protein